MSNVQEIKINNISDKFGILRENAMAVLKTWGNLHEHYMEQYPPLEFHVLVYELFTPKGANAKLAYDLSHKMAMFMDNMDFLWHEDCEFRHNGIEVLLEVERLLQKDNALRFSHTEIEQLLDGIVLPNLKNEPQSSDKRHHWFMIKSYISLAIINYERIDAHQTLDSLDVSQQPFG